MAERIKVLLTISNFNTAGSGKVLYDLAKGLDPLKFEVEIACGDDKGDFFKTIRNLGLPIHIVETKTTYRPYYSFPIRIIKISNFLRKHRYDIVHSWQWSSDWTEALAARIAGAKWIYTKKAMGFKSRHWKIKSRLAHFIITINDEMHRYFPNKKQQALIPIGIDTDYFNPKLFMENFEGNSGKFKIITVANLVPVKGIEVLIKALDHLKDSNIVLSILGDDTHSYAEELKILSNSLGLENQIKFLGKHLDIRKFIAESDLYVIPTLDQGRKEGMPMALVEAMCMAIPVLGSDITGINFVLKNFRDYLFPANNSEILASRIREIQLMSPIKRNEIGNNFRSYCIAKYGMNEFIRAHSHIYIKLAK